MILFFTFPIFRVRTGIVLGYFLVMIFEIREKFCGGVSGV